MHRIQQIGRGGVTDEIEKLWSQKERGLLTEQEFQQAKAKVLSS